MSTPDLLLYVQTQFNFDFMYMNYEKKYLLQALHWWTNQVRRIDYIICQRYTKILE